MLGTANIKVRPLKLALLVDPNSAAQVREAIRLASSLWGGMYFPIIPMYKRMPVSWRDGAIPPPPAKDVVRGYVDAFDPDILVQFAATLPGCVADMRLRTIKPQDVWRGAAADEHPEPAFGIGALELLYDIYKECFKYQPKYPTKVVLPTIPKEYGLFWASVFGEYSPQLAAAVNRHFAEPLDVTRTKITPGVFHTLTDPTVLFPRRITSWELEVQGGPRLGQHACVYFMDASSVEDVIDYWNLRATGRSVTPLPKQFLPQESFKEAIQQFLVKNRHPWRHDPKNFDVAAFVRSRHSTMEEMDAYAKTLDFPKDALNTPKAHYFVLQHWYPRIWDEWARGKDGGVANFYGTGENDIEIGKASDLEMRLKPLLPKFTPPNRHSSDGICANEFDLRLYGADTHLAEVYPKVRGDHLANAISGITGTRGGWRIGRHGLVKLVDSSWSEPRKVPASETILFAWLADHGWAAELSPPGILAKEIYKRLNGFPRLISDKAVLGLLEYMNGGSVNKGGTPGADSGRTAEREIAVGEMKKRLSGKFGKSGLFDALLEKGVFKLGLRTQCPNCTRYSWFPLSSLRESLECPKCLNSFVAAGNIEQKSNSWHYRTAGPFSVPNYADGAYAVLLTLDALGERLVSGLRTTSVPSFVATSKSNVQLEADFAMFWREIFRDGSEGLLFGECKTYGLFETRDIERMRSIGTAFPGAVLVFSTLRESLTKTEIMALSRLAKSGRKHWKAERPVNPVLILTSTELMGWRRPPYCWDEAQQKRFENVRDLLSFCDATQQLYLNLPSWHDDWHKRWEQHGRGKTP